VPFVVSDFAEVKGGCITFYFYGYRKGNGTNFDTVRQCLLWTNKTKEAGKRKLNGIEARNKMNTWANQFKLQLITSMEEIQIIGIDLGAIRNPVSIGSQGLRKTITIRSK